MLNMNISIKKRKKENPAVESPENAHGKSDQNDRSIYHIFMCKVKKMEKKEDRSRDELGCLNRVKG